MSNSRTLRSHLASGGAVGCAGILALGLVTATPGSPALKTGLQPVQLAAFTSYAIVEKFGDARLELKDAAVAASAVADIVAADVDNPSTVGETQQPTASSTHPIQASSTIGDLGDKICAVVGTLCGFAFLAVFFGLGFLGAASTAITKLVSNVKNAIARLFHLPAPSMAAAATSEPAQPDSQATPKIPNRIAARERMATGKPAAAHQGKQLGAARSKAASGRSGADG